MSGRNRNKSSGGGAKLGRKNGEKMSVGELKLWVCSETTKENNRINASLASLQRTVVDLQQAQANMVTEDKIKQWIQDAIQSVSVPQPGPAVVQKETGGFKSVGEFETSEAVKLQLQT